MISFGIVNAVRHVLSVKKTEVPFWLLGIMGLLFFSCTYNQEQKLMDVIYPSTKLGEATVYKLNSWGNVVEVLYDQTIYMDYEGKVPYFDLEDGDRHSFTELTEPIIPENASVILTYESSVTYFLEDLPKDK